MIRPPIPRQEFSALVLSAIIIVSVFAFPVTAVTDESTPATVSVDATAGGEEVAPVIPPEESISVSNNLSLWENAPLTLRADPSDAAHTVTGPQTSVKSGGSTISTAHEDIGIFQQGESLTVHAEPGRTGDGGEFRLEELQLVAVRIEDGSTVPSSTNNLVQYLKDNGEDFLTGASPDTSARIVDETQPDTDGSVSFSFTPKESGAYALVLVEKHEADSGYPGLTGPTDSLGTLSLDSPVAIVGADLVPVQSGDGSVEEPFNPVSGDDRATFDVDASGELSGQVTHTIVLFDQQTLQSQQETIVVEGDSVTQVNSTIKAINGTATIDDQINLFGYSASQGQYTGTTDLASFVDRFATDTTVTPVGDQVTVQGSVRSKVDSPETTVSVGLNDQFDAGQYKYLYVATEDGGIESVAQSGRITLAAPQARQRANIGSDRSARVQFSGPDADVDGVDEVNITFDDDPGGGSVDVSKINTLPQGTPPVENSVPDVDKRVSTLDIKVPDNSRDSSATVRTGIQKSRLNSQGVDPDDLRMYRYNNDNGQWQSLDTEVARETNSRVVLEAKTPGFSVFAIGAVADGSDSGTTTPTPTSPPGGGGGGGGGGGSSFASSSTKFTPNIQNGVSVTGITIDISSSVSGSATVSELADFPADIGSPPGTIISRLEISVPEDAADMDGTVTFTVSRSAVDNAGVDPASLQVYRHSGGSWDGVTTRVTEVTDQHVTIEADTPGFSYFAIGSSQTAPAQTSTPASTATAEPGATDTPDPTPTDASEPTATDTPEPESTETTFPGFGMGITLLAIIGGLFVLARRT